MKPESYPAELEIKESPWDSEIFGFKCGYVDIFHQTSAAIISKGLMVARNKGYKFLTTKIAVEDLTLTNNCFQCKGFLADTELTLSKTRGVNKCSSLGVPSGYSLLQEKNYWDDDLLSLAAPIKHSRFFKDPKIDRFTALKLWQTSIYNSCRGRASYSVICLYGKKPVGVIILYEAGCVSDIDLVALLSDYQGQGLGTAMMNFYENHLGAEIATQTVATQVINYPAQKLYSSFGYRTSNVKHIIHFWL